MLPCQVYAQKSLFISENDNDLFSTASTPSSVSGPIIELVHSLKFMAPYPVTREVIELVPAINESATVYR